MASTGNVFPGTGASVDRAGSTAWTSPGNVVSDNATDTTAAVPTDYLVCSNFGFAIPANATIKGVTVRVEASETGTGSSNYVPQLISATTPTLIGSPKSAVTVNGTTKVISTNGDAADLWGASLTPAIVNGAGFGVAIWSTDATNTLAIDFVTIAIEYFVPADDDENADWSGLSRNGAGPAIARVAAVAALAAGICLGLQQVQDDFVPPPATPAVVDEGYWQYGKVTRVVVAVPFGEDDIVPQPAAPALEEGEWPIPPPVAKAAQAWPWHGEDEVGTPPPAFAGEDDAEFEVVIRSQVARFWFAGDDGAATPVAALGVDEEGWQPQAPLVPAVVRLWHGEDEKVTAAAALGVDEEYWRVQLVVSQPRLTQWWTSHETSFELAPSDDYWHQAQSYPSRVVVRLWHGEDEKVTAAAPLFTDEGEWQPRAPLRPAVIRLWHGEDERTTAPTPLGVDEEGWTAPAAPGRTVVRLWHGEDEAPTPPPALDDGDWQLLRGYQLAAVVRLWFGEDERVTAAAPLGVDEEGWLPTAPLVPAVVRFWGGEDEKVAPAILVYSSTSLRSRIGSTSARDGQQRIGTETAVDGQERIGTSTANASNGRIGSEDA